MESAQKMYNAITKENKHRPVTSPSRTHPIVQINNQNSILLNKVLKSGILCLFHDNRIFAFKSFADSNQEETNSRASGSRNKNPPRHEGTTEVNVSKKMKLPTTPEELILDILTTPKYRGLGAVYLLFRLTDNIAFIVMIVLSLKNGEDAIEPNPAKISLYAVIAVEIFYDIMAYTHTYWTLQRLSLFIGSMFYVVYACTIVYYGTKGIIEPDDMPTVLIVYVVRLVAFAVEEALDIVIDCVLHNDLLILQKKKYETKTNDGEHETIRVEEEEPGENSPLNSNNDSLDTPVFKFNLSKYLDVSEGVKMPKDVEYIGSFFAWSCYSVYANAWKKDKYRHVLSVCQWSLAILILLITLSVFVCVSVVSPFFVILLLVVVGAVLFITVVAFLVFVKLTQRPWREAARFLWENYVRELCEF